MDVFALTRQLVDIESISGNEGAVGERLFKEMSARGFHTTKIPVEKNRFDVYASTTESPAIVFSTHMDTVPPFIKSSEDAENIYGRGSCDAKGIIAAQIAAAERLRKDGMAVGLLFVVGEERDSMGAKIANKHAVGSRFLVNGEPTDNRLALASKGTLRVELIALGKMAHSAYPELGESAIDKLLEALRRVRAIELPSDPVFGPSTLNIGTIQGGRAPNVIPDYAKAELLIRLIGPADQLRKQIVAAVGDIARVEFVLEIPFTKLRAVDELPTMIAAFTTDIPSLNNWGQPLLIGPGSIHVAHTEREFVCKQELLAAVNLYCQIARSLLRS